MYIRKSPHRVQTPIVHNERMDEAEWAVADRCQTHSKSSSRQTTRNRNLRVTSQTVFRVGPGSWHDGLSLLVQFHDLDGFSSFRLEMNQHAVHSLVNAEQFE